MLFLVCTLLFKTKDFINYNIGFQNTVEIIRCVMKSTFKEVEEDRKCESAGLSKWMCF